MVSRRAKVDGPPKSRRSEKIVTVAATVEVDETN